MQQQRQIVALTDRPLIQGLAQFLKRRFQLAVVRQVCQLMWIASEIVELRN